MSTPDETQQPHRPEPETEVRAHAHRGSPWAWIVVVALVLAAGAWWLHRERSVDGPADDAPAPATPTSDPPRAP